MRKKILFLAPFILIFFFLSFPALFCFAQMPTQMAIRNPINATTIVAFLENITSFLLYIALAFAPLIIIYAGILYVTSLGDPKKAEEAKKIIIYTVVGLIIIISAKALVGQFIKVVLQGQEPTFP